MVKLIVVLVIVVKRVFLLAKTIVVDVIVIYIYHEYLWYFLLWVHVPIIVVLFTTEIKSDLIDYGYFINYLYFGLPLSIVA